MPLVAGVGFVGVDWSSVVDPVRVLSVVEFVAPLAASAVAAGLVVAMLFTLARWIYREVRCWMEFSNYWDSWR